MRKGKAWGRREKGDIQIAAIFMLKKTFCYLIYIVIVTSRFINLGINIILKAYIYQQTLSVHITYCVYSVCKISFLFSPTI